MALMLEGNGITVYKFKASGALSLCREVVDLVDSGEAAQRNLDVDNAEVIVDNTRNLIMVRFHEKEQS